MQTVYGEKYADVSTARSWIWQFKQEELEEASLCDTAGLERLVTVTDRIQKLV
jgi:hypothetical protein